jgi:hypothetical protein
MCAYLIATAVFKQKFKYITLRRGNFAYLTGNNKGHERLSLTPSWPQWRETTEYEACELIETGNTNICK